MLKAIKKRKLFATLVQVVDFVLACPTDAISMIDR